MSDKYEATFHPEVQITPLPAPESTETASEPVRALPDATDASEALVQQIAEARPELHTLYRFWTAAAGDEEVDQEWEGWWSGRNWHALYDMGIWDPEFVVRWEPLVEAQVAPLRDALATAREDKVEFARWRDKWVADMQALETKLARSEDATLAAESALRQVREDLTALADEWERGIDGAGDVESEARDEAISQSVASLRGVLARTHLQPDAAWNRQSDYAELRQAAQILRSPYRSNTAGYENALADWLDEIAGSWENATECTDPDGDPITFDATLEGRSLAIARAVLARAGSAKHEGAPCTRSLYGEDCTTHPDQYTVASRDRCTVHPQHVMVNQGRNESLYADVYACECGKRATGRTDESKARVGAADTQPEGAGEVWTARENLALAWDRGYTAGRQDGIARAGLTDKAQNPYPTPTVGSKVDTAPDASRMVDGVHVPGCNERCQPPVHWVDPAPESGEGR